MAKEIVYRCDIDGCDKRVEDECNRQKVVSVIFTTEQNEGREVPPYLVTASIDICEECIQELIDSGRIITASGAMGCNTYVINTDND